MMAFDEQDEYPGVSPSPRSGFSWVENKRQLECGERWPIPGEAFLPDGSAMRPLSGLFVSGVGHAE